MIRRQMVDMALLNELRQQIKNHLTLRLPPFELEAQVGYPKAPKSVQDEGGETIRRLLLAYTRDAAFREWGRNKVVKGLMQQLLRTESVFLVQSHHNCIMTKQPNYSSETHWHRDIRYWRFDGDMLINTWLAMGTEDDHNGCLQVIPGSHRWEANADMVDDDLFLNPAHPTSQEWLEQAQSVHLNAGDVLFFHAGIFHAAGNNQDNVPKCSLVYSYHGADVNPIKDSKSTTYEEVLI